MKIFISYRRADTAQFASHLADKLRDVRGIKSVFLDVDGIDLGTKFPDKLKQAISRSNVCLILIGSAWAGPIPSTGETRINQDGDFVRLEAEGILASGKLAIPILVEGASIPAASELPQSLEALPTINGAFLRHNSFNNDVEILVDRIFGRKSGGSFARFFRRRPFFTLFLKLVGGFCTGLAMVLTLAVINSNVFGKSLESTFGDVALMWLVVALVFISGLLMPFWVFRARRKAKF